MKTIFSAGLDKERAKEIEASFNGSGVFRERLSKILMDKCESALKAGRSKEAYDCPNWAYSKADEAGYVRAMQEILNLLK